MLTLDIRHIHYTAILHALSTAACRYSPVKRISKIHRPTPLTLLYNRV